MTSRTHTKKPAHRLAPVAGVVPTCEEKNVTIVGEGTKQQQRVPAICCECGEIRDLARSRARTRGNVQLRCQSCGQTTAHAPVVGEVSDWRERANRAASEQLGDLHRLVARIESIHGSTVGVAFSTTSQNAPLTIRRYEDPEEYDLRYWVVVHEDQSLKDKREYLLLAARWIIEDAFDGPLLKDSYGAEYRGLMSTHALQRVTR